MEFCLSEEQELIGEALRGHLARACPPARVRAVYDERIDFDRNLWRGLADLGAAAIVAPQSHGGAGLSVLDLALLSEEMGRACAPVAIEMHNLACLAIARGGSAAQKEKWLPRLAAGEVIATIAFGEPGGGWAPQAWRTSFEKGAVSGVKDFSPLGAVADLYVVGCAGGRLALVERASLTQAPEDAEGIDRSRRAARLNFDGVMGELLAEGCAEPVWNASLVLCAADAFGAATRLIEMCVDYALVREQFGRPIAEFQAVKHQLADMALAVMTTRGLWWRAAYAQGEDGVAAARAAALAKAHITDQAMQVARQAVQVHGGIGFTWECDVQLYFKRIVFDRHYLGVPEWHRERVAALSGWRA